MSIRSVGVVGCGLMGSGIAQVCAQKGYPTKVREISEDLLHKGLGRIRSFLAGGVQRGKLTQQEMDQTLANLKGTTRLQDLADCDLIVEAAVENMETKKAVWRELDAAARAPTIFASNTSSLSITEMATATKRPDRMIGLHFFNPVPIMPLIEIVRPEITSAETYDACRTFGESLGKKIITAKDTPGFLVNLLLIPYILDAVRAVENGVGTARDLDTGMELGCNHPMGPIKLLDFVGLDTTLFIADAMYAEFKDPRYAAPPLLRRMVASGRLGKKAGRGFYDYS
jgi:3-hydroxybutyryl-CoA dehydrogenase